MRESPHAADVRAFLARATRRLRVLAAVRGAAIGLGTAALGLIATASAGLSLVVAAGITSGLAIGGAVAAWWLSRPDAATLIEARVPESRNVLFTGFELLLTAHRTTPVVTDRILREAADIARQVSLPRIFPARAATVMGVLAFTAWSIAAAIAFTREDHRTINPQAATIRSVAVSITPPAYAGRATTRLENPSRVEALAGSRISLTVRADATSVTLSVLDAALTAAPAEIGTFSGDTTADRDGFITLTPKTASGVDGPQRVIELAVTPDTAPRVRITAPGRDLIVASGPRTLEVVVEADDDLALESLRLRYTKISGSGENFTFADGDVAVTLTRNDARQWTARASWPLSALGLEPGDTVIYRGVATDGRPGAPPAESDALIVEIAAPGNVPAEGFAVDDRMDKYAISQQMVILRTERLIAARGSMSAENFRSDAMDIAAEQRQVRAEFVFMMGGELADAGVDLNMVHEEEEAHGEADLAAGRLVNQGRAELLRAIRAMSRASALLTDANVTGALPVEKEALDHLQKAFSRSRYILRTLGSRERLDLTRRLTGILTALARDSRPAAAAAGDAAATALQRALADLAAWATDSNRASPRGVARAIALAQQVRSIDPASAELREASSALVAASGANPASAQASIDRAQSQLVAAIRRRLQAASATGVSPQLAALTGALHDALRKAKR